MELSIIIPTYNRHHHLAECLQALEHNNAEFIVIDDGSQNPVEVPPNVRLLRHEQNRGRASAVNTGLKAASHDLVLIMDDDIYAAPDMVVRLADEFSVWNNPQLALVGRVVWDPEVKMTMTMRWLEEYGPLRTIATKRSGVLASLVTRNTMMWKPFALQHGGFSEQPSNAGLEDVEMGLRLKQNGLEIRLLASAIGFHHKSMKVRDLVNRELREGFASVSLHSKFPQYLPQVEDTESLARNAALEKDAKAAVDEIALLEQADSSRLPSGVADLFMLIYRYYFLTGILNGLNSPKFVAPSNDSSATRSLYNQASHLESIGEFSEARRLFRLVRDRQDSEYWAGAEYHFGRMESESGNWRQARHHFMNCLALNPEHQKAADGLKRPDVFLESAANVFERIQQLPKTKILFTLFGRLDEVMNAFPVIAALRKKFHGAEIVWLTSPEYQSLARASFADSVSTMEYQGTIPWDAIVDEDFSHIFRLDAGANLEEWKASGLHLMDFMGRRCGVELDSREAWLEPGPDAMTEAESFLDRYALTRKEFVTISYSGEVRRRWPCHNLHKLAKAIGRPVVIIGGADEAPIAGTVPCFGQSYRVIAALIRWSAFYLGADSGVSWLASTTETPMAVFNDPDNSRQPGTTLKEFLHNDKDIVEWDSHTAAETVVSHITSIVQSQELAEKGRNLLGNPLGNWA